MNLYDILGLEIGSPIEEIKKRLDQLEKVIGRYDETNSRSISHLVITEYNKMIRNKAAYDSKCKLFVAVEDSQDHYIDGKTKKLLEEYANESKTYKVTKDSIVSGPVRPVEKSSGAFIRFVACGLVIFVAVGSALYFFITRSKNEQPVDKPTSSYVDATTKNLIPIRYEIQPGDTEASINAKFGTNKKLGDNIYVGDLIMLNVAVEVAYAYNAELEKKEEALQPTSFEEYIVQPGDKLPEIAEEYGVTCNDIMKYNPFVLDISSIREGDTLRIPQWEKSKGLN